MSTTSLAEALFSRTRAAVLGVLTLAPEVELHGREVARRTGLDPSGVQRELRQLEQHGVVSARRVGRQKLYRLDPASPVQAELASIMRKTAGLADILRRALAPLAAGVELAYIYGSQAAGTARPNSDVDVMVVGSLDSSEAYLALEQTRAALGRAVNPTVYSGQEYHAKLALGRGFPYTAHTGPRIILLEGLHEPA